MSHYNQGIWTPRYPTTDPLRITCGASGWHLPGPDASPLVIGNKWKPRRDPSGRFATLSHAGFVPQMDEMGPEIPWSNRPYDPWATDWCIVGWASTGALVWKEDLRNRPHATWAEAIEGLLLDWADQRHQGEGP